MSNERSPLPFEAINCTEEMRKALDEFGQAITEVRKRIKWDEADIPETDNKNVFHCEHCHIEINPKDHTVMCFGVLYFYNNGDRILCYTDSRAGMLQLSGKVDAVKDAFSWMIAYGLVLPHLSRHVPDTDVEKKNRAN